MCLLHREEVSVLHVQPKTPHHVIGLAFSFSSVVGPWVESAQLGFGILTPESLCFFNLRLSHSLILKLVTFQVLHSKAHLAVKERVCIRGFGRWPKENQGAVNEGVIRVILIRALITTVHIWPWPVQLYSSLTLRHAEFSNLFFKKQKTTRSDFSTLEKCYTCKWKNTWKLFRKKERSAFKRPLEQDLEEARWLQLTSSFVNPEASYLQLEFKAFCCCLVAQSCLTLCDPMDCSTPGFPVLHYLLEFAQIHVHWVSDTMQPSHSLSPPFPF